MLCGQKVHLSISIGRGEADGVGIFIIIKSREIIPGRILLVFM